MLENFSHQAFDIEDQEKKSKPWIWYAKAGGLSVLVLAMAFFTGSFLQKLFAQYPIPYETVWVPLVVSVFIFLLFLFFAVLAIHRGWLLAGLEFVSGAIITLCVYPVHPIPVLITGGLMTLLLITAGLSGRREINASVKIRFVRILQIVISRGMFGIALLVSLLVYTTSLAHPLDKTNILLPESVFTNVSPALSQLIKPVLGDVDLSLTLSEMAGKGVDAAIENSTDRTLKRTITPQLRDMFIQKYVEQIQTTFKNSLGVNVSPNQKLSDALYNGLLSKFNTLPDASKRGIVLFFSVVFLFGIQAASWIMRIILIPIAFLLYEIGVMTKFFKVTFKSESKEIITLG